MFGKLSIEQALIETDFKRKFEPEKKGYYSTYQKLINADDDIENRSGNFTYMNGKDQSVYEKNL